MGRSRPLCDGQSVRAIKSPRRLLPVVLALAALVVSGCTTSILDSKDDYSTVIVPRLQNGEPERLGTVINEAAFNAGAVGRTIAPYTGYVGPLRVVFEGDRQEIKDDLNSLAQVVPPSFDPNETVKIDFSNASLNYILQQLLGGALGVNYVAPDNLPAGINFRTEQPIPKSRLLQVVRDLLSRSNLVMRFMNGVYQIGAPDTMEALQANSASGRIGEEISRVVKLPRGNAAQVVALASQLLPPNVGVLASSAADSVVIRANPSDVDSVRQLVLMLSNQAVGSERVAIIPLSRSSPEVVAQQLTQFYAPSLREGEGTVTVLPLQNQQAVLVRASEPGLMRGIQQMAAQLDRSVTDISELRVIALTHLRPSEIVPQLSAIFSNTASAGPAPAAEASPQARELTGVRSRLRSPQPQPKAAADNEDGTALAVPGPALSPPSGARGADGQGGSGAFPASTATLPPEQGETRIVADDRTNSILVYSTYSVFKRMREVVKTLDVAQAQVIIEATVVDVTLNDALETGVQFFLQRRGIVIGSGIPSGNQQPAKGGVIGVSTNIGDVSVDAILRALRSVTRLKVVSSPYLTVVDGQSARLVIGDQIPFASTTQTSSNSGNVTVTQNVEILDTGVVLEITPRIHANNSVNLNIVQSVSTPSSESSSTSLTPVISTRDIASQILAQSGRTILLGGLIQDRLHRIEDGVPGISRVPVLGGLFRQNTTKTERSELIVLITPRVVRSSSEIEGITRLLQGMGQDYKSR